MLLATAAAALVEALPHNVFWGRGVDGSRANHLGLVLMQLREELAAVGPAAAPALQRLLSLGRLAA